MRRDASENSRLFGNRPRARASRSHCRFIANTNHSIVCAAAKLCVVDCGCRLRLAHRTTADRKAARRKSDRRRDDTRFRLLKYCSRSEPSVENFDSPTLRLGEVLDFSLSFWPRHPAAWPAAFQVMFKNKAGSSLFELLRDVFSKNFQSSIPFVRFLMFISFPQCGITGVIAGTR
jgi:hypothetical protein